MTTELFTRPYVISWNLTYRCNLACEHCYLDAGAKKKQLLKTENFSDRSELNTEQCFEIIDQIAAFAPESLTILTGGEPLLRKDILQIIKRANASKLWVVVGTNGVLITETLTDVLLENGVRGMALSLDSLTPHDHDRFRVVQGAWENTVQGAKVLKQKGLSFIIQTTVGKHNVAELSQIADFAYTELGARVWNLYFLVQTGRGQFVSDISPEEYDEILRELYQIQKSYAGRMVVNAKCAPHFVTTLASIDPDSPFAKKYSGDAGGCPAGTHYMGIRPNGDITPCPYLPLFGGNLMKQDLSSLWRESDLFQSIRQRGELSGKCGACEANTLCGGCRARAFGVTGDYLAEDPLCAYEPGDLKEELVHIRNRTQTIHYGESPVATVRWEEDAKARMNKIPMFVRGMVVKAVEKHCRENNISVVSIKELEGIRSRMPTPKIFSKNREVEH